MHVGGLQLFTPPEGSGPEFIHDLYRDMLAHTNFNPTYRKRPARILGGIASFGWAYDDEVDVDYHLRRSALPSPGTGTSTIRCARAITGTERHGLKASNAHARTMRPS